MRGLRILLSPLLAATASGAFAQAPAGSEAVEATPIGHIEIRTVPFDDSLSLRSATYTPSGKVLVAYAARDAVAPRQLRLAVMEDDGTGMRPFFSGDLPAREKDNGIRYMVFPDNRRIFLGDFVIECAPDIDRCDTSALLPVEYPAEVASGTHIAHRWSEIIVAPDNRHIAWTTLLANYSAVVFTGELQRKAAGYAVSNPQIVSTIDPFDPDPKHPDGVIVHPLRNGEVKQFVHGGSAISMVGAVRRDLPDSVVQDLASGRIEPVTDTPGYTETTIFSPDERLGITMTTRFSQSTDPAILGLMPRPYPTSLNMGLSMFAYTYGVTGVRSSRNGNIGPALIDIQASESREGYLGINLNTQEDWVFRSPMSWHPGGTKAMWIEGLRGSEQLRMQVVHLQDYQPAAPVSASPTPERIPYASTDLTRLAARVTRAQDIDVKVYGRASGHIEYRRSAALIEKVYVDFSDDGSAVYSGRESLQLNPRGNSTYTADIQLSGPKPGVMNLRMGFGPLFGKPPSRLIFDPDAAGIPLTHGYCEYAGVRLDAASLLP